VWRAGGGGGPWQSSQTSQLRQGYMLSDSDAAVSFQKHLHCSQGREQTDHKQSNEASNQQQTQHANYMPIRVGSS
jgi:hypothetical protein